MKTRKSDIKESHLNVWGKIEGKEINNCKHLWSVSTHSMFKEQQYSLLWAKSGERIFRGKKKKKNLSGNINIEGFISKFLVLTVEPKRSPL